MGETVIEKWQWVKGDDAGTVEEVKTQDAKFKTFVSGRKCSLELIYEFMTPLDGNQPALELGANVHDLNTPINNTGAVPGNNNPVPATQISIPPKEESPIQKLIKQNKNKTAIDLAVSILIEIPSDSTYEILSSSFGEEVFDEILNDALSQIDIEAVSSQLKASIKEKLISVYNLKNEKNGEQEKA